AQGGVASPKRTHATRRGASFASAKRRDRLPYPAALMIVGDRLRLSGDERAVIVLKFLGAVNGRPVHQHVILPAWRHENLVHAEKAAHSLHPPLIRRIDPDQH